MDILSAHRERIAHLCETLDRLIAMHRRLFELRSESWREQQEGDPDRAEVLVALHRQTDEMEEEAERLRREAGVKSREPLPEPPDSATGSALAVSLTEAVARLAEATGALGAAQERARSAEAALVERAAVRKSLATAEREIGRLAGAVQQG